MTSPIIDHLRTAWQTSTLNTLHFTPTSITFPDGTSYSPSEIIKLRIRDASSRTNAPTTSTTTAFVERSYTLIQLIHCLRHQSASVGDYLRAARAENVKQVPVPERQGVVEAIRVFGKRVEGPNVSEEAQESTLHDILKKEIRFWDRTLVLEGGKSLQEVIDVDAKSKIMEEERGKRMRTVKSLGSPIIVVPSSATAVVNLYNCKEFLEQGKYVPMDKAREARGAGEDEGKPNEVAVFRSHPELGEVRYKVVDSVHGFDDSHFARIVAVIVTGQGWQLRGWKWPDPAEIFVHAQGVYLYFDDVKVPEQIRAWNVKVFPIKRDSRHKDGIQSQAIWNAVDAHMRTHNVPLYAGLREEAEVKAKAEREARLKGEKAEEEEDDEGPVAAADMVVVAEA